MTDTLYAVRPEIKKAIKALGMSQGAFARRNGYRPSTFRGMLNGDNPMDEAQEKKILSDIQAMGVER